MPLTTFVNALPDPDDFEQATASVQDSDDGHIAAVSMSTGLGSFTIQCSGDGANTLADGLELLAAKVRTAHREWLAGKAREHTDAPEATDG